MPSPAATIRALRLLHAELDACQACPKMIRPVVHGPPVASGILLVGQAPGPREGSFGRPFAWTAGRTLFRWFEEALGIGEDEFRAKIYIAAVARCFPGKAPGGGDRRPDAEETARCRPYLVRETQILEPKLVIPVGTMAIEQVLATKEKLNDLIGTVRRATFHGVETDVVPLPHPSGASPWHKMEPGKTLLAQAMSAIAKHPEVKRTFGGESRPARSSPNTGS